MPTVLRAARPDRETRAFLRWLKLGALTPIEKLPVRQTRTVWRLFALTLGRRPAVAAVVEHCIDGPGGSIRLRIFTPPGPRQARPAFLWCHGGGFMVGGLDSAEPICRSLAQAAGCVTVAVRYRLSPEHDLYAGRADFLAALDWVARHGGELGIDVTRLAIGGDSAGGNIAAAVAQAARQRGGPALRLQVLAYPATELIEDFPSKRENRDGFVISDGLIEHIRQVVLSTADPADPRLSPRRHPDLRGLPPALLVSAGFDPIRDDGLDYAARLRAAGVPVELLHYAGQVHGFLNFDAVLGSGVDVLQRIGAALAAAFRGEVPPDRTLEIAEIADAVVPRRRLRAAGGEVANLLLIGWTSGSRWLGTALRLALPRGEVFVKLALQPWLLPADLLQRRATRRLVRITARQTWPPQE
ncbi:MAG TPA: alpha/beta hydrolase [Rubrivivax sp.]|nr:alpha/beta hydrolase [Rubrivivax sp.]